jgi:hypothetical protein
MLYKTTVYVCDARAQETMTAATPELEAPAELRARLEPLLPWLGGQGVERLVVFSYCRPGEPKFWTAYLFVDGKRHTLGTPDQRDLELKEQLPHLLRQLETFQARTPTVPDQLQDPPSVMADEKTGAG